ncbi:MAG: hypothetical protein GX786_04550 [Clostridiales bacterium]|nr:hypothetical protein [Clostridiales bacterium]
MEKINSNKQNRLMIMTGALLVLLAIIFRWIGKVQEGSISIIASHLRSYIYIGMYGGWMIMVNRRIVQKQMRNLLMAVGAMAIFWMTVRTIKYLYIDDAIVTRYLWYMYYIPMNFIPTLCAMVAISGGKTETWRLPKWSFALLAVPIVLSLGVLLNDYHQLAFRFLTPVWNDKDIRYGPIYWCCICWEILCGAYALVILFQKCRLPHRRRFLLLPFIPAICSVLYGFAYIMQPPVLMIIAGDITAFQCLFFVGSLECCIQCGLIRSNNNYDELFRISSLQALITDKDYHILLASDEGIMQRLNRCEKLKEVLFHWAMVFVCLEHPLKKAMYCGWKMYRN